MRFIATAILLLATSYGFSQAALEFSADNTILENTSNFNAEEIGNNGFNFDILDAGTNTKFSEFATAIFRDKLIMVSSKKIGGLAKIDPNTNEAYKELYCVDIKSNGRLKKPLLFSRMLNTVNSEDQLSFSKDNNTVYYTRSDRKNSMEYKLYKADLEPNSHGNWINQELLPLNEDGVSVENPFVSPDGTKLYFASNRADSYGGFDIYVANIKADGALGTPKNLGSTINTASNEKYPSVSKDGNYLYFSSNGHKTIGGYDVFTSRILKDRYKAPRNMGNTINSQFNEVAYFLASKNKGYVSSDRPNGKGGYDMYTATNDEVVQSVKGTVIDTDTKTDIPNASLIIYNEDGDVVDQIVTDKDGNFKFNVVPFEAYTISATKEGFKQQAVNFTATKGYNTEYIKDFELTSSVNLVALEIDNIYFDSAKWTIKENSYNALNEVIEILNKFPNSAIVINAHTDNVGSDNYNLGLSEKRANAAVEYLVAHGIEESRLKPKGYGETQPKVDCSITCTPDQLGENRRIEFMIVKQD
jgi:outer membrane protein OmpA-like peptidoglycan-associated protein